MKKGWRDRRSKLPNRALTEAEMDAIPVTDAEEAEYAAAIDAVHQAVMRGGIPPTLDWSYTFLVVASKVLVVQGIPPEYFVQMLLTCWDAHVEPYAGTEQAMEFAAPRPLELKAKGQRLRQVLLDAQLETTADTTVMGLVAMASASLSRAGVTRAVFEDQLRKLYVSSERALSAAVQAMAIGGKS